MGKSSAGRLFAAAAGALLLVGALGGGAVGSYWIASSAYRRARFERLLDEPSRLASVDPSLWALACGLVLLVLLGVGLIVVGLMRR